MKRKEKKETQKHKKNQIKVLFRDDFFYNIYLMQSIF